MRRLLLVLVLAALPSWAATAAAQGSEFWEEVRTPGLQAWRAHVSEARAAMREHRWRGALEAADRAIATLEERAAGHVLRGRALGALGREEDAVGAFRRALELDPKVLDDTEDGPPAAIVVARAGAYSLSAQILDRVLGTMAVSKRRYELYVLYGDVLLTLGPKRLDEAILAYREGLRASQQVDVRAGLGLALALRRNERWLEATDLARRAAGRGSVGTVVAALPLPAAEKAARRAVALAAVGDVDGARAAWRNAAEGGPWAEHARTELQRLRGTRGP